MELEHVLGSAFLVKPVNILQRQDSDLEFQIDDSLTCVITWLSLLLASSLASSLCVSLGWKAENAGYAVRFSDKYNVNRKCIADLRLSESNSASD